MSRFIILAALLLGACTRTVTVEVPVDVLVPVSSPCIAGARPDEPVSLRDRISRAEWDAMSTDQRENLSQAQALDRKIYGDKLTGVTAGCR